jgi:hypothetical protein
MVVRSIFLWSLVSVAETVNEVMNAQNVVDMFNRQKEVYSIPK